MARKPRKSKSVPTADGATKPDDNSKVIDAGALTEDQKIALFFNHKKTYSAALEKKKTSAATFMAACKAIEAEGTKVADIKLALELEEEGGEEAMNERIQDQLRVAKWMGAAEGTQFAMFDDRTPAAEKAHAEGKRAGLAGEDRSCRYHESTEQYAKWMDGYQIGQTVLAAGFKTIGETDGEKAQASAATVDSLTDNLAAHAAEGKALLDEMGDDPRPRFLKVVE